MDLERKIQTLHARLRIWRDNHPNQRRARVDCIEAELVIGATALETGWLGWDDVAQECYEYARAPAAKLGIRV